MFARAYSGPIPQTGSKSSTTNQAKNRQRKLCARISDETTKRVCRESAEKPTANSAQSRTSKTSESLAFRGRYGAGDGAEGQRRGDGGHDRWPERTVFAGLLHEECECQLRTLCVCDLIHTGKYRPKQALGKALAGGSHKNYTYSVTYQPLSGD